MTTAAAWPPTTWDAFLAWERDFTWTDNGEPWYRENLHVMWSLVLGYAFFVAIGPRVAKGLPDMALKGALAAWNFFLAALTILMTSRLLPEMYDRIANRGFHAAMCDPSFLNSGRAKLMIAVFCWSKLPELVDTVFIVLRKRPLILLHYWHHFSVAIFCWYCYMLGSANGLFFGAMNSVLHVLLYNYYALMALGVDLRSISSFITVLQITQMVFGLIVSAYTVWGLHNNGPDFCGTPVTLAYLGFGMYLSYFILFAQFFVNRFIRKGGKGSKKSKTQ